MRERFDKDAYNRAIARACFRHTKRAAADCKGTTDTARLRSAACDWRSRHCWSPNQLRHALATEARRRSGLEAAQALLGHTRIFDEHWKRVRYVWTDNFPIEIIESKQLQVEVQELVERKLPFVEPQNPPLVNRKLRYTVVQRVDHLRW
jgi:hypothetical protein